MRFSVRLLRRDFGDVLVAPWVELRPLRWSWRQPGGCHLAEIALFGDRDRLWDGLNWLRCPVVIYAGSVPVWWGYVSDVGYSDGPVDVAVSLETMSNRVAVAYSSIVAGSDSVGTRATTAWASDATSTGVYGTKEMLHSTDGATATQAERLRDRLLALEAYPQTYTQASGVKDVSLSLGQYNRGAMAARGDGRLVCRGWWSTLGWRYYSNSNTASVDTLLQAEAVIGAAEFLTPQILAGLSGIATSEYRDGDGLGLAVLMELLRSGTNGGSRLSAHVTIDRRVVVQTEPASSETDWRITPDGLRDRWGALPLPGIEIGGWARLHQIVPASANLNYVSAPSPLYIEENEFDAAEGTYRWRPRGMPSPWELGAIGQG